MAWDTNSPGSSRSIDTPALRRAARTQENRRPIRSLPLWAQLGVAFLTVALISVAGVAFWAHRITALQLSAYHERIRRGEVSWMSDQPPAVREVVGRSKPIAFRNAQAKFLSGFNRSLWFGGATAGLVALAVGMTLARRLSRPLNELKNATGRIAAGHLSEQVHLSGSGEFEDVADSFNAMAGQLRESERLRSELLAAIAHELRTPLAIIQGNLEAMLDEVNPPTPERLASLHTHAAMLSRLITDLLELSLAEAGQLTLHRAPTDLYALAEQCVSVPRPWLEDRRVGIVLSGRDRPIVNVDVDRVRQVLLNLLDNAVRFTPHGGTVRVTVRAEGEEDARIAELAVEDEGPGIPPDDLARIFEPFYRSDPSRSRASGGSGLGLAVVKHLVAVHGGEVRAENLSTGGAKIVIRFPALQ